MTHPRNFSSVLRSSFLSLSLSASTLPATSCQVRCPRTCPLLFFCLSLVCNSSVVLICQPFVPPSLGERLPSASQASAAPLLPEASEPSARVQPLRATLRLASPVRYLGSCYLPYTAPPRSNCCHGSTDFKPLVLRPVDLVRSENLGSRTVSVNTGRIWSSGFDNTTPADVQFRCHDRL